MECVYHFIREYKKRHNFSPSFKEIGEACFMSQGNVVRYIDLLEAKGRITRHIGIPRSIAIPEDQ